MLKSRCFFDLGRGLIIVWLAALALQQQTRAAMEKVTGDDFFFPHKEMKFSGFAFTSSGSLLHVDDKIDIRFEQARCGFVIHQPEEGLSEWQFAIYETVRQSRHNVRLAALPSMMTRGILANATEGLEPGNLAYLDKRWKPVRPVRLVYGPIIVDEEEKPAIKEEEVEKLGGSAPDLDKFGGSDYFISFVLPHLEDSSGVQDVTFVIYFQQGVIQGFEYRLVAQFYKSVNLSGVVPTSILDGEEESGESHFKKVGSQKYFPYMSCR